MFGVSEAIRHDRETGFVSDYVWAFKRIVGQRRRATMTYRSQANGTTERMIQTLTLSLKVHVADVLQQDWDERSVSISESTQLKIGLEKRHLFI